MTCDLEDSAVADLLPLLTGGDADRFKDALRLLVNAAMLLERQRHLGAEPHERTEHRNGHANGFKGKRFQTRLGALELRVPQVRGSSEPFYPQSLEKGLRSERALKIALAEMYVQGVQTQRSCALQHPQGRGHHGAAFTEQLCGFEVSSTQVSRAAAELDVVLQAWRERPLGDQATPYLILDARYEKVRQAGVMQDAAVLIAVGVGADGKRRVLGHTCVTVGVSVSLSEHEVHWRAFLKSLVERGLSGVRLITSDAHAGLSAARQAVFGSVPWQRCQFHLQQNAQAHVPRQEIKTTVAADIRAVFNASDRAAAETLLKTVVARYEQSAPNRRFILTSDKVPGSRSASGRRTGRGSGADAGRTARPGRAVSGARDCG
jgi:Transposase and inactivated derivatives